MNTLALTSQAIITDDWQVLPLAKVMHTYLRVCEPQNENTQRCKQNDINHFLAYMGRHGRLSHVPMSDYTPEAIQGFLSHRLEADKVSTVARRYATLRAFDKWLGAHLPTFRKPTHQVKPPSPAQSGFRGISPDDARKLQELAYQLGDCNDRKLRNGFAVHLLLATGLRAEEILRPTEAQLSRDGRWLRNVWCKHNKYRDVYLPVELTEPMHAWMRRRESILQSYGVTNTLPFPLLLSTHGAKAHTPESFRMDYTTLRRIVVAAAESLEHVTPHMLRHTFAHGLLDATKDIRAVCQALGHSDVKTTMRYTERDGERMAELIERSRPR